MASNPETLTLSLDGSKHVNGSGVITCSSHSLLQQEVKVDLYDSAGTKITSGVFEGNGENLPMYLQGSHGTKTALTFNGISMPAKLVAKFMYYASPGVPRTNPGNKVFPVTLVDTKQIEVVQVTSEDGYDHDDNDSYLIVSCHKV